MRTSLRAIVDRSPLRKPVRALAGRRDWVRVEHQPPRPAPLGDLHLFGLIGTWYEGDVIEACVRNAFAQGCERVFVVDNDSPDDTVEVAVRAGAEVAGRYWLPFWDEKLRTSLQTAVMRQQTALSGYSHVWWLWIDADEFPHGPNGQTVGEYARSLDARFRVVGARYFEHYPSGDPPIVPGQHPLDVMPLCEEYSHAWCPAGHQKHPLIRVDHGAVDIEFVPGFHRAKSPRQLVEPAEPIFVHHFPFRARAVSRARLERLCTPDETGHARVSLHDAVEISEAGGSNSSRRVQSFDDVYAGNWDRVLRPRTSGDQFGIAPRPWTELVETRHTRVARWY